jgi:hypothetical protein
MTTRPSKSYRKKLRMQAFNRMNPEEQVRDRMAFKGFASCTREGWDTKLTDTIRKWPEYKVVNREDAQLIVSSGGFVVRPSSFPGYLSVTYAKGGCFINILVKYESGELCVFSKDPYGPMIKAFTFKSQDELRTYIVGCMEA